MKIRKIRMRPKEVYKIKLLDVRKFMIKFPESGRLFGKPYFSFAMTVKK